MDVSILLGLACLMAVWVGIRCRGDKDQTDSAAFLAVGFGSFAYWWLRKDVNWPGPVFSSVVLLGGMVEQVRMTYRRRQ